MIYSLVTDPAKIATILLDVRNVRIVDANTFSPRAKLGISFVKGLMNIICTITEKAPFTFLKLKATANGLSSIVQLESSFTGYSRGRNTCHVGS